MVSRTGKESYGEKVIPKRLYRKDIDMGKLLVYTRSMTRVPRKNAFRYRKILTLREKGMNFREIGEQLGISRQRAQQIFARAAKNPPTNSNLHDMGNHGTGQSRSA